MESDSDTSKMSIDSPPGKRASQTSEKKYQAEQDDSDMTRSKPRHTRSPSKKSGIKEDFNQSDSDRSDTSNLVWSGPILARTIDEEEFIIILCKSIATLCIAQLCVIVSHLY